ncbi:helix-turn-helix domain-containing protein [Nonomuraea candida]|uniref:helix-turn-helix domain-containing protein n=1 Tax=Nonomuraea candida TaxID=359159 RepID=UPI000693D253|nr:helix-turn-helix domain-containing protein [Nonomuraea candida]
MELESALPVGSDHRRHAHLLSRIRDAVLAGDRPVASPRPLIAESWNRVRRLGVDPERGRDLPIAPREEVEWRRRQSRIGQVLDVLRGGLTSISDDGVHIMVITDADGCLLWQEGSPAVRREAESLGFAEGAVWDEAAVGTNGIGTGLVVQRPVQIFAAEHFVRGHDPWICTAAPLHDPVSGQFLGVVDVSGPAATAHPSTLALVHAVTSLANASFKEEHQSRLARLRAAAAPVLARVGGCALVTDRHGWVAAVTGMWPGDRVLLPEELSGGDARIAPFGLCRVEPLFEGWLIRVGPPEPDRPTTVRLNLSGDIPTITVVAPSGSWQHRLTPRHAEILLLLALNPAGLSAAELAEDLFGDRRRKVTVRAELSRLRQRLGDLFEQRPYRFASWLDVRYELPQDRARLLLAASSATVRTLRSCATPPRPGAGAPPAPG